MRAPAVAERQRLAHLRAARRRKRERGDALSAAAHQPTHTTVNQHDHHLSGTDQTLAPGLAVNSTMPGIQRRARTGTM